MKPIFSELSFMGHDQSSSENTNCKAVLKLLPSNNLFRCLALLVVVLISPAKIASAVEQAFVPFTGMREGWYYNLKHPDSSVPDTDMPVSVKTRIVGLKGPFENQDGCQFHALKSDKPHSACYLRETRSFYQWRSHHIDAWVLPLATGEDSKALIFPKANDCWRVALSGFYKTSGQLNVSLRKESQYCLKERLSFGQYEDLYGFTRDHPPASGKPPAVYQAWSMAVDEGRYVRLLQFLNKSLCELVARDGMYYSKISHRAFQDLQVTYQIPLHLRHCERRQPKANEVPFLYPWASLHSSSTAAVEPSTVQTQQAWVMGVNQPGGILPLYFRTQKACMKVLYSGKYFMGVFRGGIFKDIKIRKTFDQVTGLCEPFNGPLIPENYYPFAE
ncbi:MAG: hypothetical protein HQM11_07270 [SAR324 cluster bacterium]|nr:hypothetical protein [SAR324 cluster bacterium]